VLHTNHIRVTYRRTEFKELTAHFQFPADYPSSPLTIELKSKPLDFKLLQGLEKVCTDEVKKYVTKQQVREGYPTDLMNCCSLFILKSKIVTVSNKVEVLI